MRSWNTKDQEGAPCERAPSRVPPAPRAFVPGHLLAMQRTAGNQAVGRALQRMAVVGIPGPNNPKTTYSAAAAGNLVAALPGPIAGMPPWAIGWLQPHLTALEASPATYEFDNVTDIAWWIVVRELATDLLAYIQQPPAPGQADTGGKVRRAYATIEAQRALYAQRGAASQSYQLFNLTYQLTNQGANHYYAARPAGRNIEYHGLPRSRAKALVNHLVRSGANAATAAYPGEDNEVDDFVCAFLAEPTRWAEEQVFNVLTLTRTEEQPLTGSASPNALPMAAGGTWNAALNQLGHDAPKRALRHATAEGLMPIVRQELPLAGNWAAFLTAMRGQLDFG